MTSTSFPWALFTKFPFLGTYSHAKTVKNMRNITAKEIFNWISKIILCESSERHSDFLFFFFFQTSDLSSVSDLLREQKLV